MCGSILPTLRAMALTYRPYVPEQDLLLPPSVSDWLAGDHLAYFVSDLIRASRRSTRSRTRETLRQPSPRPTIGRVHAQSKGTVTITAITRTDSSSWGFL